MYFASVYLSGCVLQNEGQLEIESSLLCLCGGVRVDGGQAVL